MQTSQFDSKGVAVELRGCAKSFGDHRVLEPMDLQIHAGETLVLLGPSGCGKSTTLRLIAGLEAPDAGGQVWFGGFDVTDIPIERRSVGMVFQSYALFPNMSVQENIEYGLKVRGVAPNRRQERARQMMEMVEISSLASRRIQQLSGGQKQRVALARALAPQPQVLLLDEPLTALDARLRESLRAELNQLLRRLRTTAVYVTHDQAEAMSLADRVAVMERGRICQIGTPRQIYQQPANDFVAQFIGTMNRVRLADRERMFRPEDATLVHPDVAEADLSGVVIQAQYLGERTQITIQADCAAAPLIAYAGARSTPALGERVGLRVAHDAWVEVASAQR